MSHQSYYCDLTATPDNHPHHTPDNHPHHALDNHPHHIPDSHPHHYVDGVSHHPATDGFIRRLPADEYHPLPPVADYVHPSVSDYAHPPVNDYTLPPVADSSVSRIQEHYQASLEQFAKICALSKTLDREREQLEAKKEALQKRMNRLRLLYGLAKMRRHQKLRRVRASPPPFGQAIRDVNASPPSFGQAIGDVIASPSSFGQTIGDVTAPPPPPPRVAGFGSDQLQTKRNVELRGGGGGGGGARREDYRESFGSCEAVTSSHLDCCCGCVSGGGGSEWPLGAASSDQEQPIDYSIASSGKLI